MAEPSPRIAFRCLLAAGLATLTAACTSVDPGEVENSLVPVTAIAASESATMTITMLTSSCIDPVTEVEVSEAGGEAVSIAVRYGAASCDDVLTFTDIAVRLDGPLGSRALELTQPEGFERLVGSDICIIDGQTNSERCRAVVGSDDQ